MTDPPTEAPTEAPTAPGPIDPPRHPRVQIHYRRLPDRETIYDQRVVLERADVVITLSEPVDIPEPMVHEGRTILEPGSLALWFTFPGLWHDVGRFHTAGGAYLGLYANILTPPAMGGPTWHTTDLFLDVWWPSQGAVTVLDQHELEDALASGAIDPEMATRARAEAERLVEGASSGAWPPPVVREWTLGRALAALEGRHARVSGPAQGG